MIMMTVIIIPGRL